MTVKRPPRTFNELLGRRFCNIMQEGCPPQPDIVCFCSCIVKYLEGVMKVVLMAFAILVFNSLKLFKLRKDLFQQSRCIKQKEACGRYRCGEDLIQFHRNPFSGNYL